MSAKAAVVIPAKDEARRVASTVHAAASIPSVDLVVVVDDGSADATARVAEEAGAIVARHESNRGKAAAMETGAEVVRAHDARAADGAAHVLLFLDADLEDSAAGAAPLVPPVLSGDADMTIAVLPPQHRAGGGHGLVVRLSRDGIRAATGWEATQPLSGQRCLTQTAYAAARPLAGGFGVETGLTIDLLRRGLRVLEVECELHHRVTGKDLRSQLHRGRQYRDVARALAARRALRPGMLAAPLLRKLPVGRRAAG
jgi:glycosyltransferase involved in cell wall biosynthesis